MYTDFKSLFFVFAYDRLLESSLHFILRRFGRLKSIVCLTGLLLERFTVFSQTRFGRIFSSMYYKITIQPLNLCVFIMVIMHMLLYLKYQKNEKKDVHLYNTSKIARATHVSTKTKQNTKV
jgi:hypothetical protein